MTNCRCAKCRRREIYKATGMTLSLAWNKELTGPCCAEKAGDAAERRRSDDSSAQERPAVKEAS